MVVMWRLIPGWKSFCEHLIGISNLIIFSCKNKCSNHIRSFGFTYLTDFFWYVVVLFIYLSRFIYSFIYLYLMVHWYRLSLICLLFNSWCNSEVQCVKERVDLNTWILNPALTITSCVTLDMLHQLWVLVSSSVKWDVCKALTSCFLQCRRH